MILIWLWFFLDSHLFIIINWLVTLALLKNLKFVFLKNKSHENHWKRKMDTNNLPRLIWNPSQSFYNGKRTLYSHLHLLSPDPSGILGVIWDREDFLKGGWQETYVGSNCAFFILMCVVTHGGSARSDRTHVHMQGW